MPDGEINVAVKAEGVDEAAADMGGDGGDGGDGGGGLGGGIGKKLGTVGKLLGVIVGLLAAIPGIFDMIGAVFKVLQAFLAPLSVMLMRILQPVLRWFIRLLPRWFDFMSKVDDLLQSVISVLQMDLSEVLQKGWDLLNETLENIIGATLSDIVSGIADIPGDLWTEMKRLPDLIADALTPGGDEDTAQARQRIRQGAQGDPDPGTAEGALGTMIRISGGLFPFIEQIEQDDNFSGR